MANKKLFASLRDAERFCDALATDFHAIPQRIAKFYRGASTTPPIPATDTLNHEFAPAYRLAPHEALAQYAATGCFGRTFYADASEQLAHVLQLCEELSPEFVAKTAIYARTNSLMKDMPALLCAWLSRRDQRLHEAVFSKVIDNARMLRTYVQILRSGAVGRKSLGTAPKRLVREWLAGRREEAIFTSSTGQSPSLADILKMVHPKPATPVREAFYAYLLGRPHDVNLLPELVRQFEQFKTGESLEAPNVPFMMLSALPLTQKDWVAVARNTSWQTTRMNLNTFARHGVFDAPEMAELIAARLRDPGEIRRARIFPYQLMAAFVNCDAGVPLDVRMGLQDAMELAIANVPAIDGHVVVCPDVSGSMSSPATGYRKGSTSWVRCIDIAALVAASVLRKNPTATVLPFEHKVATVDLNPRDTVMTNAQKLASIGGGGTNCSAPIRLLNERQAVADLIVFISDNESWVDRSYGSGTALIEEWSLLRERNPKARLVCLDIQPNRTTQAVEREDILNIAGFSDQVFELISAFAAGQLDAGHWVARIEQIAL
jgi:60 kDa SS-A/Ro ribonucleoprotein